MFVERAQALLVHLLPAELIPLLPQSSITEPRHRLDLLTALSSGQLLCVAYNTGVRRSRKPWGYISKDSIHDVAALEAAERAGDSLEAEHRIITGWTFRRTDNLRLWIAYVSLKVFMKVELTVRPI